MKVPDALLFAMFVFNGVGRDLLGGALFFTLISPDGGSGTSVSTLGAVFDSTCDVIPRAFIPRVIIPPLAGPNAE